MSAAQPPAAPSAAPQPAAAPPAVASRLRVLVRVRPMTRHEAADPANARTAVVALPSAGDDAAGADARARMHVLDADARPATVTVRVLQHLRPATPALTGGALTIPGGASGGGGGGGGGSGGDFGSFAAADHVTTTGAAAFEQTFDRVFAPGASQLDIFEELRPLVLGAAEGVNATVFAYGQTGSASPRF